MAEHHLAPNVDSVHWGYLDASIPPVLTIDSGDIVTVGTVSGGADQVPPAGNVCPELWAIHDAYSPAPGPHILTGPIFVRGAMPGDFLKIEILDVALRDDWGFNITVPGKGVLPDDFDVPSLTHFAIDRTTAAIRTPWGATTVARPFFGVMATAPRQEDGRLSSVIPGYFGGNMDNKELVAGSTLFLPVSVEGGLLSVGDGHAVQGDGEVGLTAVETGLTGRLRVSVIECGAVTGPHAETDCHVIAMAFDEDLNRAIPEVVRSAIVLIRTGREISAHEAYVLCSIGADLRITQLVNVKKGVHLMVSKSAIAGRAS